MKLASSTRNPCFRQQEHNQLYPLLYYISSVLTFLGSYAHILGQHFVLCKPDIQDNRTKILLSSSDPISLLLYTVYLIENTSKLMKKLTGVKSMCFKVIFLCVDYCLWRFLVCLVAYPYCCLPMPYNKNNRLQVKWTVFILWNILRIPPKQRRKVFLSKLRKKRLQDVHHDIGEIRMHSLRGSSEKWLARIMGFCSLGCFLLYCQSSILYEWKESQCIQENTNWTSLHDDC